MGWRLWLLRPGVGGLSLAQCPGSLGWQSSPGWPRMGGEGGVGPTLVWYLLGVGVVEPGGWEAGTTEKEPTAGLAAGAVTAVAAAIATGAATAAAAGAAVAVGAVAGGTARWEQLGWSLQQRKGRNDAPNVEKRGLHGSSHARAREGEETEKGGFRNLKRECELKRKERKWVLYRERAKIKGLGQLMALSAYLMAGSENKRKINGGCRKRRACTRRKMKGAGDEQRNLRNFAGCEISQPAKFCRLRKFQGIKQHPQPTTTPAIQKSKNYEKINL